MRLVTAVILGVIAGLGLTIFLGALLLGSNPTQSVRELLAARRQGARYDRRLELYRQLQEDQSRVLRALIAGQLTLRQAAQQFRDLHAEAGIPEGPDPGLRSLGEEAWCARVLIQARYFQPLARARSAGSQIWRSLHSTFRRTFGHPPPYCG